MLLADAGFDHVADIPEHRHIRQFPVVDELLPRRRLVALHRDLRFPRFRDFELHSLAGFFLHEDSAEASARELNCVKGISEGKDEKTPLSMFVQLIQMQTVSARKRRTFRVLPRHWRLLSRLLLRTVIQETLKVGQKYSTVPRAQQRVRERTREQVSGCTNIPISRGSESMS